MDKKQSEITRMRLIEHIKAHPRAQIRDLFKYLHQSALGCEHLVANRERALDYILREYESLSLHAAGTIEPLDGAYSRVPLSYLKEGLTPETLSTVFCRSAKKEPTGEADLQEKLQVARHLAAEGVLPFSLTNFDAELDAWRQSGFSALHHSEEFRAAYAPAYRVIANGYVKILPLLSKIDTVLQKKGQAVIAIEGGSASGKTTLAATLEDLYGCTVFHMDDFFLRPEQRTAARLAEIGGNVDRERFLEEVLHPLSRGENINYQRFDCATQSLLSPTTVAPGTLTVIEGAYSMHSDLAPYYDLSVFLDVTLACQRERILKRNTPAFAKRFFEEWIPLEHAYFTATNIKARCDLSVTVE